MPKTLTVKLSDIDAARLTKLRGLIHGESETDVIRNAMRLMEHLIVQTQTGLRLYRLDAAGQPVPYPLFETS